MFKNILVPTDGSGLSAAAICTAVRLAKTCGASITCAHVAAQFDERAQKFAEGAFDVARREGEKAGVKVICKMAHGDHIYKSLLALADKDRCDVIVMASHGRGNIGSPLLGISSLLLGSETHKVLAHTKLPVLVCH